MSLFVVHSTGFFSPRSLFLCARNTQKEKKSGATNSSSIDLRALNSDVKRTFIVSCKLVKQTIHSAFFMCRVAERFFSSSPAAEGKRKENAVTTSMFTQKMNCLSVSGCPPPGVKRGKARPLEAILASHLTYSSANLLVSKYT